MSKKSGKTEPSPAAELTFEEALGQLEAVIRDLEDGRLGLNESLVRYEEGVRLLRQCHGALNDAERKILLLTSVDESGTAIVEPFDDRTLSLDEKRDQRSRRRSRSAPVTMADSAEDTEEADEATLGEAERESGEIDRQKGLF